MRRTFLEKNIAASALDLMPAEVAELDAAIPPGSAAGPRYTEAQMATLDR